MAEFKRNWRVFDRDSTDTCWIANMKAGGERATKTAQSTYWSCCDTIRTQILNCRKKCWLLRSGFGVETRCNCSVLGWNRTGNWPGNLDPLLTLNTLHASSWKWASTERQRFLVMYHGYSGGRQVPHCHKLIIDCLYRQMWKWNAYCPIFKMSVNRVSTIVGLPSWLIAARCGGYRLYILFWLLLYATRLKNT
jgi:hypothetical protein